MRRPQLNTLQDAITATLDEYDCYRVAYLDLRGEWRTDPKSLRDRISSELWYTLHISRVRGTLSELSSRLYAPLLRSAAAWRVIGKMTNTRREAFGQDRPAMLMASEALCQLIKYAVVRKGTEDYVAVWNSAEKIRKAHRINYLAHCTRTIENRMQNPENIHYMYDMLDELSDSERSPFGQIVTILYEEEKVRRYLSAYYRAISHVSHREALYSVLEHLSGAELELISGNRRAYLRPCLAMLVSSAIPVTSGMQYELSGQLGRLRDPRSLHTMLRAVADCDRTHVNVKCNLIYAVGSLSAVAARDCLVTILTDGG